MYYSFSFKINVLSAIIVNIALTISCECIRETIDHMKPVLCQKILISSSTNTKSHPFLKELVPLCNGYQYLLIYYRYNQSVLYKYPFLRGYTHFLWRPLFCWQCQLTELADTPLHLSLSNSLLTLSLCLLSFVKDLLDHWKVRGSHLFVCVFTYVRAILVTWK